MSSSRQLLMVHSRLYQMTGWVYEDDFSSADPETWVEVTSFDTGAKRIDQFQRQFLQVLH